MEGWRQKTEDRRQKTGEGWKRQRVRGLAKIKKRRVRKSEGTKDFTIRKTREKNKSEKPEKQNKPDKPEKQNKQNKPNKPEKPDKPEKRNKRYDFTGDDYWKCGIFDRSDML